MPACFLLSFIVIIIIIYVFIDNIYNCTIATIRTTAIINAIEVIFVFAVVFFFFVLGYFVCISIQTVFSFTADPFIENYIIKSKFFKSKTFFGF